jgi:serine O-acetyltransferase
MNFVSSVLRPSERAAALFAIAGSSSQFSGAARTLLLSLHSSDVSRGAVFGRRLRLPHPINIVVGKGAVVGDDVTICQNVTIGHTRRGGYPTLGDRVTVFPGAVIVGAITIGDDAIIGPNSLVTKNVPSGGRARAPLAEIMDPTEPSRGADSN